MANVAAITIVYNEKHKLPRWLSYYRRQLGQKNCFVIDHGSDDGSTNDIDQCQIIKLPRTPYDNQVRIEAISSLAHFLLKFFDYVIYTDCDEIVVADPQHYKGLGDYCNKLAPPYIYSIGIDVVQRLGEEGPLDPRRPVLEQRQYAHFSSAMCKPNLTRLPIRWARGFHSHQREPFFGSLFNFHLRYVDLDEGVARLGTTRSLHWAKDNEGAHHKVSNAEYGSLIESWSKLPIVEDDAFCSTASVLSPYLDRFVRTSKYNPTLDQFDVDLFTFGAELIRIPPRFRVLF